MLPNKHWGFKKCVRGIFLHIKHFQIRFFLNVWNPYCLPPPLLTWRLLPHFHCYCIALLLDLLTPPADQWNSVSPSVSCKKTRMPKPNKIGTHLKTLTKHYSIATIVLVKVKTQKLLLESYKKNTFFKHMKQHASAGKSCHLATKLYWRTLQKSHWTRIRKWNMILQNT